MKIQLQMFGLASFTRPWRPHGVSSGGIVGQRRHILNPQRSLVHLWGSELRVWRDRRRLSLAELGAMVFYDASHLGKFERGERVPPHHVVEACDRELEAGGELIRLRALIDSPTSGDGQVSDEANWSGDEAKSQPPVREKPAQLPADVSGFSGRSVELAVLDELALQTTGRRKAVVISALSGTPGVGKTTLAVHWAHRVTKSFPDGQLYVNLRGFDPTGQVKRPIDAVRGFLHSLGVPAERVPDDVDAQAAMYRSLLDQKRMLVLLDNARDSEQVRPLLPGSPGCFVVVTSRSQLAGLVAVEGAHLLALDLLTFDDARQLLASRLGQERVEAEPQSVEQIIQMCARLPLALTIVAARAARHPRSSLSAVASELEAAGGSLEAFSGGEPVIDIRALFSWSYETLTGDAARLFRLLSLHPGPDISINAVASLAGVAKSEARQLLKELTQACLVEEGNLGRHAFHDLLRSYSTELVRSRDTSTDRRVAIHRMLDYYLCTVASSRLGEPVLSSLNLKPPQPDSTADDLTDHDQSVTWLAAELAVLLPIIRLAAAQGFDRYTCELTKLLAFFFDFNGHWHEWLAAADEALRAAHRLADEDEQADAYHALASASVLLGRYDDAHAYLRRAFDLCVGTADRTGHHYQVLGWLFERQGRYDDAVNYARLALEHYRAADDPIGQAHSHNDIGFRQALLGEHQAALASCREALDLAERIGHRYEQAASCRGLGYAHHYLGHHEQASHWYQRSIQLHRGIGDLRHEAEVLHMLGDTLAVSGQPDRARQAWLRALDVFEQLDHVDAESVRHKLEGLTIPGVARNDHADLGGDRPIETIPPHLRSEA